MLALYPKDSNDSHGQPYWSGPKRAPTPFDFDANDEMHLSFVVSCANLIASNLCIAQEEDKNLVYQIAVSQHEKPYI